MAASRKTFLRGDSVKKISPPVKKLTSPPDAQYGSTFTELDDLVREKGTTPRSSVHHAYIAGRLLEGRLSRLESLVAEITDLHNQLKERDEKIIDLQSEIDRYEFGSK